MIDQIKRDILFVLNELLDILKAREDKDVYQIKELSNHIIHNASVFQDEYSVSIAVLVYALSKIMERNDTQLNYARLSSMISSCIASLKNSDDERFRKSVKDIFNDAMQELIIEDN